MANWKLVLVSDSHKTRIELDTQYDDTQESNKYVNQREMAQKEALNKLGYRIIYSLAEPEDEYEDSEID